MTSSFLYDVKGLRDELNRAMRFTGSRVDVCEEDVALAQEDATQALTLLHEVLRRLTFERWTWTVVFALQIVFDAWVVFGDHFVIG